MTTLAVRTLSCARARCRSRAWCESAPSVCCGCSVFLDLACPGGARRCPAPGGGLFIVCYCFIHSFRASESSVMYRKRAALYTQPRAADRLAARRRSPLCLCTRPQQPPVNSSGSTHRGQLIATPRERQRPSPPTSGDEVPQERLGEIDHTHATPSDRVRIQPTHSMQPAAARGWVARLCRAVRPQRSARAW